MLPKRIPKVGLVAVSLAGERVDLADQFFSTARSNLVQKGFDVIENSGLNLTGHDVMKAVTDARNQGADCIIYLIGTWIYAPDIVTAIQQINLPTVIWGIPESASFSSVGTNVLHG